MQRGCVYGQIGRDIQETLDWISDKLTQVNELSFTPDGARSYDWIHKLQVTIESSKTFLQVNFSSPVPAVAGSYASLSVHLSLTRPKGGVHICRVANGDLTWEN